MADRRELVRMVVIPAVVGAVLNAGLVLLLRPPMWAALAVLPLVVGVPTGVINGLLVTRRHRRRRVADRG